MQDTISSVFLAGRDGHARLRQFARVVLALAVMLHLTAFVGYTRTVHDADAAKAALARLDGAAKAAEAVERDLHEFEAVLVPEVKEILGRLLAALQQDFVDLGGAVNEAVRQDLKSSSPRDPSRPRIEIQQGPAPEISPLQRRLSDAAIQSKIRAVKTSEELRAALDPIIAETIVKRRFDEANAAWTAHVAARVRPLADAAAHSIGETARASGTTDLPWSDLVAAVGRCAAAAERLRFDPPAAGEWWRTRAGKAGVIDALEHEAAGQLVDGHEAAALSGEFKATTDAARAEAERLEEEYDLRRVAVEEQAKRQVEAIADLAKPLGFVAVDIGSLVRWFPLVIGMALAVAILLGTEARRGYRDALDVVETAARDDDVWSRVVKQARAALGRGVSPWLRWPAVAAVWTGLAAWRLASLDQATPGRAVLVAAFGVAIVAAALAHRSITEAAPRPTS
jgi:hypothetical protein